MIDNTEILYDLKTIQDRLVYLINNLSEDADGGKRGAPEDQVVTLETRAYINAAHAAKTFDVVNTLLLKVKQNDVP